MVTEALAAASDSSLRLQSGWSPIQEQCMHRNSPLRTSDGRILIYQRESYSFFAYFSPGVPCISLR